MSLIQCHRNFNPRSREGSDNSIQSFFYSHLDFNPRSREGSDGYYICKWLDGDISIRAPARGATRSGSFTDPHFCISIRAPARGATLLAVYILVQVCRFQSALPRGERPRVRAPGGALENFNPRSREGSDIAGALTAVRKRLFQSALPRGERQSR